MEDLVEKLRSQFSYVENEHLTIKSFVRKQETLLEWRLKIL